MTDMTEFEMALNELEQAVASSDPDTLASAIVMLSGVFVFIGICAFLRYLLTAIGYSKMFKKAGIPGWKAFIPVYNDYNRFKMSWNTKAFWIFFATSVIFAASNLYKETVVGGIIAIAVGLVSLVYGIKMTIYVAKSFGKGAGTGWLLYFFSFIVSLVLGSKAEYIGNTTVAKAE